MSAAKKPIVLLILDGWGYREEQASNAISNANKPVWDQLWARYPKTLISGSGMDVGLPDGQMGNSEVGHVNLGAGRVVYQDFTRITKAIHEGTFFDNETLCAAVDSAVAAGKAVHIMGLLSPGGVHSHLEHILAAIELAAKRGAKQIYVHGFLDGRDMPPRSAQASIEAVDAKCAELGVGQLASVVGRYYAMDRDKRWDRVQTAYDVLTLAAEGAAFSFASGVAALEAAYARDENDEFVKASVMEGAQPMQDGDALLFMNFRADRAREITQAFIDADFDGFARKAQPAVNFVMLTEYSASLKAPVAFPSEDLVNTFGEYMQNLGKTQLRIAETEKYAHVTFFFSGGREEPYQGEQRVLVNSPDVATYDLQPEMSAPEVTDKLVAAITGGEFDAIICNYANPDMVGHTGNFEAATQAIEALDVCIGRVIEAVQSVEGQCLITADHGNADMMEDVESGQAHTAHTCNPVPFIYIGKPAEPTTDTGVLSDVAPTMLYLMGLEQPAEMTGKPLMRLL